MTMEIGAPLFMAPELYSEEETYDYSVDVFAFAVLICALFEQPNEMDDGNRPPRTPQMLMRRVSSGARWRRPKGISDGLWQLVTECWRQNPAERPTFSEIVDRLKGSVDLTFPGTDLSAYKEFQDRLSGDAVPDARPVELIDGLFDVLGWDDARNA
jgi:serine/threonine protein kinase